MSAPTQEGQEVRVIETGERGIVMAIVPEWDSRFATGPRKWICGVEIDGRRAFYYQSSLELVESK